MRKIFLYFCLCIFGSFGVSAQALELTFGVYTSDKPSQMVRTFRPVLNRLEVILSERLSEPVTIRMQVASDYEKGIEQLVSGEVDFVRFGPASYVLAKERNPGIAILAMESKKGEKTFKGVICIHQDSDIVSVADLKGQQFAFGNQRSTIGRYLSQLYLTENGLKASDLASYDYLDRHDKVALAVADGKFAAGAVKEGTYKKMRAKGAPLKVLATFDNVTKPWIVRSGMDENVKDILQESLLNFDDQEALKRLKKDGFLPGSDEDYRPTRIAMQQNSRFFEEQ